MSFRYNATAMTLTLTNKIARHLVLHLQGLTLPLHRKQTSDDLYTLIHQLGFVQVDSIQWLERAHHMILFARNHSYRPKDLKTLVEDERRLFEGWTHDAAFIPSAFYPYWRHRFQRQESRLRERFVKWQGDGFLSHCDELLTLISTNGAIRSRDLERPARQGHQEMWQWHDAKAALEYLWRTGQLAIAGRDGFQKRYDLTQRVMREDNLQARCELTEFIDWACRSALERLGFGSPADIARYWDLLTIQEVKDWLAQQGGQRAMPIKVMPVDGAAPRECYARPDLEKVVASLHKLPERLRALSPFDPVIRDRNRLQWLFGFEYRIEIYVPEAKRKYGYYVFPLLEKSKFVGRIDMRANRQRNTLQVKKLWLEKNLKLSNARKNRLLSELLRQARHAGVDEIECRMGSVLAL